MAYAKELGKLITFDPNLREPLWESLEEAKKQILWGLQQADVVKISDNEVDFLFDLTPEEGAMHILNTFGCKLVFVTCGPEGAVFANKEAFGKVPGIKGVKVVDTTGAGDIFGGSAVIKILDSNKRPEALTEEELEAITRFACAAASLSTQKAGGVSSVPALEEVLMQL